MVAACATHIHLPTIPAHVIVIRDGHRLKPPSVQGQKRFLARGDEIRVRRPGHLSFSYGWNRYRIRYGDVRLVCRDVLVAPHARHHRRTRVLGVRLESGRLQVLSGVNPRRAVVMTPEMLTFPRARHTLFIVKRNGRQHSTRAWTLNKPIVSARTSDQNLRLNVRFTYTATSGRRGRSGPGGA